MSVKVNGIELKNGTYVNGETSFRTLSWQACARGFATIDFVFEDISDIWSLIVTKKYLDDKFGDVTTVLNMPYMPYSNYNDFTIKYFCRTINELNFSQVKVLDPVNRNVQYFLDRCICVSSEPYLNAIMHEVDVDFIIFMDNESGNKYNDIASNVGVENVGFVEDFEKKDFKDKNVLIVGDTLCHDLISDICKNLYSYGASDIFLYVPHLTDNEYPQVDPLRDCVNKIFVANSTISTDEFKSFVKVIKPKE